MAMVHSRKDVSIPSLQSFGHLLEDLEKLILLGKLGQFRLENLAAGTLSIRSLSVKESGQDRVVRRQVGADASVHGDRVGGLDQSRCYG